MSKNLNETIEPADKDHNPDPTQGGRKVDIPDGDDDEEGIDDTI
jgi:hypothetical protein